MYVPYLELDIAQLFFDVIESDRQVCASSLEQSL
jgi:hypothetical protein